MLSRLFSLFLLLLSAAVLLAGCGAPTRVEPEAVENGLHARLAVVDAEPWTLQERMAHYGVPGVSLAVIADSKIAWARGYGNLAEGGAAVTPDTLFRSTSGSMLVSEIATLAMAAAGQLDLDGPANDVLSSWKIPDNELTAASPVTFRHLLMHTSGLSPNFYAGYRAGDEIPTLVQLLDGAPPSRSPALRAVSTPGTQTRQSAGGLAVLEQALVDISGKPFPELAGELVLEPLGMSRSALRAAVPPEHRAASATGHRSDGRPLDGQVIPDLAASGLWTTASDLARLLIEIQNAVRGEVGPVLTPAMIEATIAPAMVNVGEAARISARGLSEGFYSQLVIYPNLGLGAVFLANSTEGQPLATEVFQGIARAYDWPNFLLPEIPAIPMSPEDTAQFAGRYGVGDGGVMVITAEDDHLLVHELPARFPEALYRISEDAFVNQSRGGGFSFQRDGDGRATAYVWTNNGQETVHPRLADGEVRPIELLVDGRIDEALAAYRARDSPPPESRLNLAAYALLGQGRTDEAVALFELICELYPLSANARDSLADGHLGREDLASAVQAFEEMERLLPFDTQMSALVRDLLRAKARYYKGRYEQQLEG